ncbi:uncharacterized protein [Parasteatoda tepidariorum]|uniref:uncharacterized protein n=1 Tax=Parasteatoda tepidariorum TaxID=114398 RepID=UPI0039BC558F
MTCKATSVPHPDILLCNDYAMMYLNKQRKISVLTMRRFFHRKGSQAKTGALTTNAGGVLGNRPRSSSSSNSPNHVSAPTGRVRAPALRSRSMSTLNGPEPDSSRTKKFTRSLSFCAENQSAVGRSMVTRQLTKTEEDEVFRMYTRLVYGVVGALCAVIVGIAMYAYFYTYGTK